MAIRSKRFELTASVDREGCMRAEGGGPIRTPEGWTPDHLLLAAVARCSLGSLRHHARRAGLAVQGAGEAHGTIARRQEDGRYALVEVTVALDVQLDPPPDPQALGDLLARAERDCFAGASLRTAPTYAWTVNGVAIDGGRRQTAEEAA